MDELKKYELDIVFSNLSDIYDANPGDELSFPSGSALSDIYAEMLANDKLGRISTHPFGHHVLNIYENINATDFAKLIVGSKFNSDYKFIAKIPSNVTIPTLRSLIYSMMKYSGLKYKLDFTQTHLIATKKVMPTLTGKELINELFIGLTVEDPKQVRIERLTSPSSAMTLLYREAVLRGIKINIKITDEYLTVTKKDGEREYGESYFSRFKTWLTDLTYDTATQIPDELMTNTTTAYIKTVISKSGFDCKYNKGLVTKVSVALRRKAGKIDLCAGGRVLKTFDTARVCHLTSKDRALVNLLIKPYGKTFEEL